ncbi:MAG TPA: hypothetical protein ENG63_07045 [Candidatus Desulfofervidus auxilii]|uniref:Uncharacterized protein n=1 Tax=Desulfofervidus auxilii TaxID=1621989 RepID=A0A7C0Y4W7_DESA2|nr:hypothetical protein [Candidatus Desulfofervidus auxilii]
MTRTDFMQILTPLLEEFQADFALDRLETYYETLKDFSADSLKQAIDWWRREMRYFPTPEELKNAIYEILEPKFEDETKTTDIPQYRINLFYEIAKDFGLNPPPGQVLYLCSLGESYDDEEFKQAVTNWCGLQTGNLTPVVKKFKETVERLAVKPLPKTGEPEKIGSVFKRMGIPTTLPAETEQLLKALQEKVRKKLESKKSLKEILPSPDSEEYKTLVRVYEAYQNKKLLDTISLEERSYAAEVFSELRKNNYSITDLKVVDGKKRLVISRVSL